MGLCLCLQLLGGAREKYPLSKQRFFTHNPFPSLPFLAFFFFSFSFLLSFLPATISWYDGNYGYVDADCPVLAICYTSGRMQLMRSESDSKPVLIDALMEVVAAK